MKNNRYLIQLISISLIIFSVVAAFNFIINPFDIMNSPRFTQLNQIKPEAATRVQTLKKYQPIYFQPSTIIVGNSRVEMGLNPNHPSFNSDRVYNLGIPGISIAAQLAYAQHVIEHSKIDNVVIAIDFVDFLNTKNYQFKPITLSINELEDKAAALASLDALIASFTTIFRQTESSSTRLSNGFNPAREYQPIIKFEGQDVLFTQKIAALNKQFKNKYWLQSNSPFSDLSLLKSIISQWKSNGIEVSLFINPYHQDYYQALSDNQLLSTFELWRKTMKTELSLMTNFCDFTNLGHQKSHQRQSKSQLMYFWEPAHYKKELGDIMLPKILQGCD